MDMTLSGNRLEYSKSMLQKQEQWLHDASPAMQKYFKSEGGPLQTLQKHQDALEELHAAATKTHSFAQDKLSYVETGIEPPGRPGGVAHLPMKVHPGMNQAFGAKLQSGFKVEDYYDKLTEAQGELEEHYQKLQKAPTLAKEKSYTDKLEQLQENVRKVADVYMTVLDADGEAATQVARLLDAVRP
jgi:hypothetical protein